MENAKVKDNIFQQLSLDQCRETIRSASKESLPEIVQQISESQYEYSKRTLPERKAGELQKAWEDFKNNINRA